MRRSSHETVHGLHGVVRPQRVTLGMNTDSSENVVVVELKRGRWFRRIVEGTTTRATDGFHRVWNDRLRGFDLRIADIRRVNSRLEAPPDDHAFLAAEFPPTVTTNLSFRRPPPLASTGITGRRSSTMQANE
jgi:hypothetical protein